MIDSHLVRSGFHFIQINLKLATFRQIDYLCPTREYNKYWQSRQYLLYLQMSREYMGLGLVFNSN